MVGKLLAGLSADPLTEAPVDDQVTQLCQTTFTFKTGENSVLF